MMNSVTYYSPTNEPLFNVQVHERKGKWVYLISYPPCYSEVTEYSSEGMLYLLESAYKASELV